MFTTYLGYTPIAGVYSDQHTGFMSHVYVFIDTRKVGFVLEMVMMIKRGKIFFFFHQHCSCCLLSFHMTADGKILTRNVFYLRP